MEAQDFAPQSVFSIQYQCPRGAGPRAHHTTHSVSEERKLLAGLNQAMSDPGSLPHSLSGKAPQPPVVFTVHLDHLYYFLFCSS